MLRKLKWIHLIAICLIGIVAINFGTFYQYTDIKDVLSTLQNISVMIFTIAGIWLAYIYPKAITAIVKPSSLSNEKHLSPSMDIDKEIVTPEKKLTVSEKNAIEKDISRITMIVEAIISSALVIFFIILINVFKPILINITLVSDNVNTFNKLGCFVTLALVYIQIISLFSIIASNIVFLNDVHNEKNDKELDQLK